MTAQQPDRSERRPSDQGLALRRGVVACAGFALVVVLAVVAYRQFIAGSGQVHTPPDLGQATAEPASVSLPPTTSPYLNTTSAGEYVGSEHCTECHREQHATYRKTTHSQSLSLVDPAQEPPDSQFEHAPSGLRYEVHRDDERLWHRESFVAGSEPIETANWPLKYLVGSGRFARTYLAEIDGFLVESPLSWYALAKAWRMSPGYDEVSHLSFQRNVTDECLFCHAGRTSNLANSPSRIKLQELAIGCERCHGPGSIHVARHRAGEAGARQDGDQTIVNPRRLSRELSEAICQQCHLESIGSSMVQGRTRTDFRPGLRWTDFCVNYDAQSPSGRMTVTGHVQQMHRSRCYQDSTTLTCITCHDMHAPPSPEQRAQHYRAACLACHEDSSCKLAAVNRQHRNENDCAACHMPQSPTDVPHVAFTHHRIGLHTGQPDESFDEFAAVPFTAVLDVGQLPEDHRQRNLGLAYLHRYVNFWQDSRLVWYHQQGDELLSGVYRRGLRDEAVTTALAVIAGEKGDLATTVQLAERALRSGQTSLGDGVTARNLLANAYFQQRRFQDCERVLNELILLRRDPRDWVLLGRCREQQNNVAGAISALEQILEIDPRMPETYEVLGELYGRQGAVDAQRRSLQRAQLLRKHRRE